MSMATQEQDPMFRNLYDDQDTLPPEQHKQLLLPSFVLGSTFAQRKTGDYFTDECPDVPCTD